MCSNFFGVKLRGVFGTFNRHSVYGFVPARQTKVKWSSSFCFQTFVLLHTSSPISDVQGGLAAVTSDVTWLVAQMLQFAARLLQSTKPTHARTMRILGKDVISPERTAFGQQRRVAQVLAQRTGIILTHQVRHLHQQTLYTLWHTTALHWARHKVIQVADRHTQLHHIIRCLSHWAHLMRATPSQQLARRQSLNTMLLVSLTTTLTNRRLHEMEAHPVGSQHWLFPCIFTAHLHYMSFPYWFEGGKTWHAHLTQRMTGQGGEARLRETERVRQWKARWIGAEREKRAR